MFDYFGKDEAIYFFEKYDRKKHLPLGDLLYTIKNLQNNEEVDYIMTLEEKYERRESSRIQEAIRQGMAQGVEQGLERSGNLIEILLNADRIDDLKKAASDSEYMQKLFEEYNI